MMYVVTALMMIILFDTMLCGAVSYLLSVGVDVRLCSFVLVPGW
jgi:hypothetical protein